MQDDNFSDTKVNLTLGGKVYLLNFGLKTLRRIEEEQPGFTIVGSQMPPHEILPFLIRNAVTPQSEIAWENDDEFVDLYDACTDEEGLAKTLVAYQNAMGFIDQRFSPVMGRILGTIAKMQQADAEIQEQKSTTGGTIGVTQED